MFNDLPTEVVEEILMRVDGDSLSDYKNSPNVTQLRVWAKTLRLVCRQWSAIVYSLPNFWVTYLSFLLCVCLRSSNTNLLDVKVRWAETIAMLEQSPKKSLLCVSFRFMRNGWGPLQGPRLNVPAEMASWCLPALEPFANRIWGLEIATPPFEEVLDGISRLGVLSCLEILEVGEKSEDFHWLSHQRNPQIRGSLDMTRAIGLKNLRIHGEAWINAIEAPSALQFLFLDLGHRSISRARPFPLYDLKVTNLLQNCKSIRVFEGRFSHEYAIKANFASSLKARLPNLAKIDTRTTRSHFLTLMSGIDPATITHLNLEIVQSGNTKDVKRQPPHFPNLIIFSIAVHTWDADIISLFPTERNTKIEQLTIALRDNIIEVEVEGSTMPPLPTQHLTIEFHTRQTRWKNFLYRALPSLERILSLVFRRRGTLTDVLMSSPEDLNPKRPQWLCAPNLRNLNLVNVSLEDANHFCAALHAPQLTTISCSHKADRDWRVRAESFPPTYPVILKSLLRTPPLIFNAITAVTLSHLVHNLLEEPLVLPPSSKTHTVSFALFPNARSLTVHLDNHKFVKTTCILWTLANDKSLLGRLKELTVYLQCLHLPRDTCSKPVEDCKLILGEVMKKRKQCGIPLDEMTLGYIGGDDHSGVSTVICSWLATPEITDSSTRQSRFPMLDAARSRIHGFRKVEPDSGNHSKE